MRFVDYLRTVNRDKVMRTLSKEYPSDPLSREDYEEFWDTLLLKTPSEKNQEFSISCAWYPDHQEHRVFLLDQNKGVWSTAFVPWADILAMEVNEMSTSDEETVAHILWEMSFYGIDEALVMEKKISLQKQVDEIDAILLKEED